jgi:hypothetical protein
MVEIISIEVTVIKTVEATKPIISIEGSVAKASEAHSGATRDTHSGATRHSHSKVTRHTHSKVIRHIHSRATRHTHSRSTRHTHSRVTRHTHSGVTSEGMSAAKAPTVGGSCDKRSTEYCRDKAAQENYNFWFLHSKSDL